MDISLRFFSSPVKEGALLRADFSPKESYKLSARLKISEFILNGEKTEGLIHEGRRRRMLTTQPGFVDI
jgi:hypothetical protein